MTNSGSIRLKPGALYPVTLSYLTGRPSFNKGIFVIFDSTKENITWGFETVNCILCERKTETVVVWPAEGGGHIVRCCDCGLVFRNPRWIEEELYLHFEKNWTEAQTDFSSGDYRTPNLQKIVDCLLQRYPVPGKILDIGCSYGTLLSLFPETWQRFGVEPSKNACTKAEQRLPQAKIFNAALVDADLPEKTFDIITMVDTIYYLPNPLRDLRRLPDLLRPGGMVLIEAQNFANRGNVYRWLGQSFPDSWMYFYTLSSLEKILKNANLQVMGRLDLPGHRTGSSNFAERIITRAEFALLASLETMSGGYVDLVPYFALMAKGCRDSEGSYG